MTEAGPLDPSINACAIETSSSIGSVAVLAAGEVRDVAFGEGMRHGRDVVPELKRLLGEAGLAPGDLGLVVCGLGPGSYTGLRIGVVAARTLAYALDCPVLGVASHDALALALHGAGTGLGEVVTLSDARRGAVYHARYGPPAEDGTGIGRPLDGYRIDPPDVFLERLTPSSLVTGPGLKKFGERVRATGARLAAPELRTPAAQQLLRLGVRRFLGGERMALPEVEPLYLRESVPGWKS